MSKRKSNKKVVTTQEFMERAREAIRNEKEMFDTFQALCNELDKIMSDGQKQQLDEFMSRIN